MKLLMKLIDIHEVDPTILLDIRYATTNNFVKTKLYSQNKCFLREPVALRLSRVQKSLRKHRLGLKVFDGYRPLSTQEKFWEICPNADYVANPNIGSKHNRGAAIDCTLVDWQGRGLEMPSDFDDFSKRACRNFSGCSLEAKKNRDILEQAMALQGFLPYFHEWWHFDDPEWMSYEILDVPFEMIES